MWTARAFDIPPAPLALTLAGLAPFLGGAACMLLLALLGAPIEIAAGAVLAYSAVILSFLGGARWGVEIAAASLVQPRWSVLGLSVLGALAGWAGVVWWLVADGSPEIFLGFAAAFALHWAWDLSADRALPHWYAGLRTIATAGAAAALVGAWAIARFV
ncbi:MAG: DUF3429 domain-containing protein [Pseudomonadota bacterium]